MIRPMKIGLTGQIGAGKSTVASVFKSQGATIIDADAIGKEAIGRNVPLLRRLVRAFGHGILTPSGLLNKSRLADLAFADVESTDLLNRLVHPHLLKELHRQVRASQRAGRIAVVDAALLHHWHLEREMDITIVVSAPRQVRLQRMHKRGITRTDALKRDRAQLSFAQMKRRSAVVIRNAGSRHDLRRRALQVWRRYVVPAVDR